MSHLLPGSELGIVLSLNTFACEGYFDTPAITELHAATIRSVMEQALASSNAAIAAVGAFVSGLLATGVHSKYAIYPSSCQSSAADVSRSKLRTAWEASHDNGHRLLYGLLFAFLVSIEFSGDAGRILSQLEAGRDIAASMGGVERSDGVGQGSLGMWYATRLYSESSMCHWCRRTVTHLVLNAQDSTREPI